MINYYDGGKRYRDVQQSNLRKTVPSNRMNFWQNL